jgi:HD superfamily phosphohydrolase
MAERPRVFRDPVHGLISVGADDPGLGRALDTRALQRLRRIRQDGFAALVYPGAEHSRFGHALGAFHVARRVTASLGVPADVARHVRAAALLHDLGHGPFSHAWESALGGASHEEWGARILAENEELGAALGDDLRAAVAAIFAGRYQPRYARKLVASEVDVDRMDYLLRDAHYTGTGYSLYDLDWMIHALALAPVAGGGEDLVVDYGRGLNVLAQFLFGRFYMYAQVYYHKTVRAAELMFGKVMERFAALCRDGSAPPGLAAAARLARGEPVSVGAYLGLDDHRVWCALEDWGGASDPVLADLAGRLAARRLFKAIEVAGDVDAALEARLAEAARARFGAAAPCYYAVDRAERQVLGQAGELTVVNHPRLGTVPFATVAAELVPVQPVTTVRVLCASELVPAFRALVADAA